MYFTMFLSSVGKKKNLPCAVMNMNSAVCFNEHQAPIQLELKPAVTRKMSVMSGHVAFDCTLCLKKSLTRRDQSVWILQLQL